MSLWSRIANVVRGERLRREIDEELESHLAEAVEHGRDPAEARRAFGPVVLRREEIRDIRAMAWLDSLRADAVFGWRQIRKRRVTSTAAVLSLGLAIGSCTAAFRLIDALLLRPLPVADPGRLYVLAQRSVAPGGKVLVNHGCTYPMFRQLRAQVKDQAELIAVSGAERVDLTYRSDEETEKAYQQYVSGWMFSALGLRPALGRLFTANDDRTPGSHPYAVLSYDYWTRRFTRDPQVIGRTFRTGGTLYQIVGVAQPPFTGTDPGTVTDFFVPTMMMKNNAIFRTDYVWFRTFLQLKTGSAAAPVLERLRAAYRVYLEESVTRMKGVPRAEIEGYVGQRLFLEPAAAGLSPVQEDYGRALWLLGALVALVLLITCANVANLMTARAAARAREMALRVSIGAGRWRLVQLVLMECAWLAALSAVAGGILAWWSAPLVVAMIGSPANPVRLVLPADGRVFGFGFALAAGVTLLLSLAPALHASRVRPSGALKGGEDPHARRRLMHALISAQAAFCCLVLFVAGLLVATFQQMSHQATGFSADRLLTLETVTPAPQASALWEQVAARLRSVPGVESVAICEWPLLAGESWNGFVSVNGAPPGMTFSYFLSVSPGFRELMKIPLLGGRDFDAGDRAPGTALVNEAFARQYFGTENAVGRWFDVVAYEGVRTRYQVVGLVGDTRYRDLREPMRPIAYFPFGQRYERGSFLVRTAAADPLAPASALRREVARARPGFRVSSTVTEEELVQQHAVRERLLATLALFFAAVALLLAGIGLYGVLDYSVVRRRREIGIRMAIGAQAGDIARRIAGEAFALVLAGASAGLALGIGMARYIQSLFYDVQPTDPRMLALPLAAMLAAALLAALPAVARAVRTDPAASLRSE